MAKIAVLYTSVPTGLNYEGDYPVLTPANYVGQLTDVEWVDATPEQIAYITQHKQNIFGQVQWDHVTSCYTVPIILITESNAMEQRSKRSTSEIVAIAQRELEAKAIADQQRREREAIRAARSEQKAREQKMKRLRKLQEELYGADKGPVGEDS